MKIFVLALVALLGSVTVIAQTQTKQPAVTDKIGYVDIENVIVQLPEYKTMETKLQETQKKLSDELFTKRQNFERMYTEYMREGKSMADSSRVKAEEQLQAMDAEIQQFQMDAQKTFENTRKFYLSPLYLKLGGVIRDVAIENGFSMILPYRVGNGELLIHADTKLDVSALVIKKYTGN